MLKTKTWALIFGAVLLISALCAALLWMHRPDGGAVVRITQDGVVLREIDLSRVSEPYSFVVEDPNGGQNTISVEPGRICVSEADCPDQICVHRGWSDGSGAPIVCLPHRLSIVSVSGSELDSVSQ